ncbi:MAG: DUF3467 domain-containing protein [Acidobacteriaceae bacterium]|nr:DUF3467 domain-containing protein [Acidobacteriaceae bacterium]
MHDSEGLEGRYANYFQLGQNAMEFIIEFGQLYESEGKPLLHTRIVTSPGYVNQLLELLLESLADYEARFGRVR